ncbi:Serine/threonine-protein kinase HuSCH9 [Hanseniaspora uvarum DSM 2768]|nr:Serine/threonine-protein kinase HuSCH9 [Hanseniaspora uvarum DSM 2768]
MNFNFINNNGQGHDQDNQKFHNPLLYNFNSTVTNTENTNWNSSNISNDYSNKGYQTLQEVMSSMQQNDSQRQPLTSKPKYTSKKRYGPEDFQVLKLLGKGTFGQVYQVKGKKTNKIYAMKVLSKSVIIKKNEIAHTIGERNILVKTSQDNLDNNSQGSSSHNLNNIDVNFISSNQNNKRCPFIVGLKFSFQTPTDLYLVIDFMAGGELFWHLQKAGRFSELRTKFYIAELVIALEYLHDNDIIYRDLKPENILLDSEGHIALCDFGLSKDDLKERTKTFCGTTEYLAPELLLDETGYTKMVDFWSLGVLIFEMCCGWSPFFAEDNQQMYQKIAFGKVKFPRDVLSPYGRSFVKGLLNRNPRHRLGAIDDGRELRKHPFLQDIDWDLLLEKKIQPPFKPIIQDDLDTSNFDPHFTAHEIDHQMFFPTSVNTQQDHNKVKNTPLSQTIQNQFQGFTFVDHSAIPLESPSQNSIANLNSSYMNRKLLQNSYFLQQGSFIPGDPNMPADEDVIDENEGWLQQGGVDMDIIDTMAKDDDEDEHMGFQFD